MALVWRAMCSLEARFWKFEPYQCKTLTQHWFNVFEDNRKTLNGDGEGLKGDGEAQFHQMTLLWL